MRALGGAWASVRVPRAIGPLAAIPVAGIVSALCAVTLLDDEGAPHLERPAPAVVAARPQPAPRVELVPPPAPRREDDSDVDPLESLLIARTSHDEATRAVAAGRLGRLVPALEALHALTPLLDDDAPEVILSAATALAETPEGRRALAGRLRGNDPPALVHLACLDALRDTGTQEELPVLLEWARREGPTADCAAMAVRAVCARTGVEPPSDLPSLEAEDQARPERE